MKPKTRKMLSSLTSMKRQRAEQDLGEAQQALAAAIDELEAIKAQLKAPTDGLDFAAVSLSAQNGHAIRLLGLVRAQGQKVEAMRHQVELRKDALRKAFGTEQVLDEVLGGRN